LLPKNWASSPIKCGTVLLVASLAGLALANSPWSHAYFAVLHTPIGLHLSLGHWISDGLMTLFFLNMTLEIKREATVGYLASAREAALPAIGALGGMIGPALIYAAFTWNNAQELRGWAIPAATDAAFTVPIVAALANRVPSSVRAFLVALAIFDDVLAIVVIAVCYSSGLSWIALSLAGLALAALVGFNRLSIQQLAPYLITGFVLWLALLQSGIHPTLAGVLTGLCVPSGRKEDAPRGDLPVQRLETAIQPYVSLLILPIFGLANLGIDLDGLHWSTLLQPVAMGTCLGLFLGKQIGVFGFVVAAIQLRIASKPEGASYLGLYGVSILCGIGFTISLFISSLAFNHPQQIEVAKVGILVGSTLSALVGFAWIRLLAHTSTDAPPPKRLQESPTEPTLVP
jgi:NhaA family Na+:H+ antiporter